MKPTGPMVYVDLDGTLAKHLDVPYKGTKEWEYEIGSPIAATVNLIKELLAEDFDVWIFTARAHPWQGEKHQRKAIQHIEEWCKEHIGVKLPVTATKNPLCVAYLDDRAIAIEHNTGKFLSPNLLTKHRE